MGFEDVTPAQKEIAYTRSFGLEFIKNHEKGSV